MRTFEKMKLKDADKTTWIFGAGASRAKPYSVPVQSEMLKYFLTSSFPGKQKRQEDIIHLKEQIRKYCCHILPGIEPDNKYLSLEEVFSGYEIVLAETRAAQEERRFAENALRTLRDAIRLATYVHGRGDARKWKPHARRGVPSPYAELIEKIFPNKLSKSLNTHSFITFNYDICLDRCLINLRDEIDMDLDYGIVLANSRSSKSPHFAAPRAGNGILLLRTHGALNWLRCEACYSVFTTVNRHAHVTDAQHCWSCGSERLDYVLVHPSFTRAYKDPVIQLVWGRCQEELVLSDRWNFIGYSLPMADVHFRELLRHCLRKREKAGKITEVCVVGRRQSDGSWISQNAWMNFKSLFGSEVKVWEATDNGFEDFPLYVS